MSHLCGTAYGLGRLRTQRGTLRAPPPFDTNSPNGPIRKSRSRLSISRQKSALTMRLFKVLLLAAGAAALKTPTSAWRATTRFTGETFREPTARHMFGKKGGGESEAERLDREQEELNQRWAKESAQETQLMSIFGVVTSIPARSRRRCIRSLRESPSKGRAPRGSSSAERSTPRAPLFARTGSLARDTARAFGSSVDPRARARRRTPPSTPPRPPQVLYLFYLAFTVDDDMGASIY